MVLVALHPLPFLLLFPRYVFDMFFHPLNLKLWSGEKPPYFLLRCGRLQCLTISGLRMQWRTEGGFKSPPEIPKALQNRAKLNPIVKTVKNCW